jgi:hypothetical protein
LLQHETVLVPQYVAVFVPFAATNEGGAMASNPEGRAGREWLIWAIDLTYGKAVKDLPSKEREAAVRTFYEFCTPKSPRKGKFLTMFFKWVIPGRARLPLPSVSQVDRFREQARKLIESRLSRAPHPVIGIGASANYQENLVSYESPDPVDTAITRFGHFMSGNWKYIRRCPRADYPKERCRRVFVLKKLPDNHAQVYCSHRCRQRVRKRKAQQILEERYGVRGPKPKEGG